MGSVLADLLPAAVVIAVGPLQIIAVILLLFSRHATANSLAFLGGWITGVTVVSALAVIIERPVLEATNGNSSMVGAMLQVLIGVGLLVLAVRQWRSHAAEDETAKLPGWLVSIERVGPAKAVSIGLILSGPNIKIVLLTFAVMLAVTEAHLSGTEALVAVLTFVVVASSSVIAPVLGNLLLGQRATSSLVALRGWLDRHYAMTSVVVMLLIGVVIVGKGLKTLIS